MKPWFSLLMIVALTLAACAPSEIPDPADWCYDYNWRVQATNSNGSPINIIQGAWFAGSGIFTDNAGSFSGNFTEPFYIRPNQIQITVARPSDVSALADINIDVLANVFGASFGGSVTMPGGQNEATVLINNTSGPTVEGNTVNASVQASHRLQITNIKVFGSGVNPYPRNDCGAATSTPTNPNTPTLPPSLTPTGCWSYTFNFRASNSWTVNTGSWTSGQGYVGAAGLLDIVSPDTSGINVSQVIASLSMLPGEDATGGTISSNNGVLAMWLPMTAFEPIQVSSGSISETLSSLSIDADLDGSLIVHSLTVYGSGPDPSWTGGTWGSIPCFGPTNTPDPTMTESPTPTPTFTPGGPVCWRIDWDFRSGDVWNSIGGTTAEYVAGQGYRSVLASGVQNVRSIRIASQHGTSALNSSALEAGLSLSYTPGTGAGNVTLRDGTSQFASFPLATTIKWTGPRTIYVLEVRNTIGIAFAPTDPGGQITVHDAYVIGSGTLPTWTGGTVTTFPCIQLTWTPTPTPGGATATPTPTTTHTPTATNTPSPTRTPLPSQIPPTATRTPIPSPPPIQPSATRTPTLTRTATNPPAPTTTPPPTNTPGPTWTPFIWPTNETTTTPWATIIIPDYGSTPNATFAPGATLIGPGDFGDLEGTAWPTPNVFGEYHGDAVDALSTAVAGINSLPDDITSVVPGMGPGLTTYAPYAAGFISGVNLQELVGLKLYPLVQHTFFGFTAVLFIVAAQVLSRLAVLMLRFVYWLVRLVLKPFPFVG